MSMPSHSSQAMPPPSERCAARARRARAWAWPVRLALLACLGLAIWQEPRLSPWLHERMQQAAAHLSDLDTADRLRGMIARMKGGGSSSGSGGLSDWFIGVMLD
mgnify:CR=1 FL=1|jgi:hypothetical protein